MRRWRFKARPEGVEVPAAASAGNLTNTLPLAVSQGCSSQLPIQTLACAARTQGIEAPIAGSTGDLPGALTSAPSKDSLFQVPIQTFVGAPRLDERREMV